MTLSSFHSRFMRHVDSIDYDVQALIDGLEDSFRQIVATAPTVLAPAATDSALSSVSHTHTHTHTHTYIHTPKTLQLRHKK